MLAPSRVLGPICAVTVLAFACGSPPTTPTPSTEIVNTTRVGACGVVMRVSRSFEFVSSFTSVTSGPVNSVMGYPTASVTTILTKQ